MNIIKLKDTIMTSDINISEMFNTRFKGRYAYWIQMRYIMSFDDVDNDSYMTYEQLSNDQFKTLNIDFIDTYDRDLVNADFFNVYVDLNETNKANEIYKFINSNKYATDKDITINEIRMFRTWLASELFDILSNDKLYDDNIVLHMLEYYKNNMHDDVLKYLNVFTQSLVEINVSQTNCECCNSSSIYNIDSLSSCDAKQSYISGMHTHMVNTFRDMNFWNSLSKNFLMLVKKYIDNIISLNLTINKSNNAKYNLCNCNFEIDNTRYMLQNLSIALDHIIKDEISGNKNFISDSLYNWAEHLYEHMIWN